MYQAASDADSDQELSDEELVNSGPDTPENVRRPGCGNRRARRFTSRVWRRSLRRQQRSTGKRRNRQVSDEPSGSSGSGADLDSDPRRLLYPPAHGRKSTPMIEAAEDSGSDQDEPAAEPNPCARPSCMHCAAVWYGRQASAAENAPSVMLCPAQKDQNGHVEAPQPAPQSPQAVPRADDEAFRTPSSRTASRGRHEGGQGPAADSSSGSDREPPVRFEDSSVEAVSDSESPAEAKAQKKQKTKKQKKQGPSRYMRSKRYQLSKDLTNMRRIEWELQGNCGCNKKGCIRNFKYQVEQSWPDAGGSLAARLVRDLRLERFACLYGHEEASWLFGEMLKFRVHLGDKAGSAGKKPRSVLVGTAVSVVGIQRHPRAYIGGCDRTWTL